MKKYLLIFLSLVVPFLVNAQRTGAKYLEGAVSEVNGKVIFSETISVKDPISDDKLFALMDKWAKKCYNTDKKDLNNRILLSNADTKKIACSGEEYLVFQSSALSLDRAKMMYQLILEIKDSKCYATVRNIRYSYSDSKDVVTAEEKITDKYALNKNKDKLNRYYDKFRIHTIDSIQSLFNSIDIYLNGVNKSGAANAVMMEATTTPIVVQESVAKQTEVVKEPEQIVTQAVVETLQAIPSNDNAVNSIPGYRSINADKIPGNIIKLLSDAMLIMSGTPDQVNVMAASWGGLGRFWEKPVAFCFLNPTRFSVKTMDKGDTYTLSFYTEAYRDAVMYCGSVSGRNTDKTKGSWLTLIETPSGAFAFSEAWLIIECKKLVAQQLSPDAVVAKNLPTDWTKNGYHKMYIGEILNVWVK